jgi:hypothetical protein
MKKDFPVMKINFLRTLFVSAVMMGGLSCVHASDSSLDGMFGDLLSGRTVTISKSTFQGYLSTYPILKNELLAEIDIDTVLSQVDELRIRSNFQDATMTFDLYSDGFCFVSHVLQNEDRADLEGYREVARQYLASSVAPKVETKPTPTATPVVRTNAPVLPVVTLSPIEQEIADLKKGLQTRVALRRIKELEAQLPGK